MNQKDSDMVLNVALIPGDGIGREVVPEGLRVLEALAERYGFEVKFEAFPYGWPSAMVLKSNLKPFPTAVNTT
jgi:isocitrate/isopropylmalate dehydrogenase